MPRTFRKQIFCCVSEGEGKCAEREQLKVFLNPVW